MLRRLAKVLVIGAALLGIGYSSLACSMAGPVRDCCPPGQTVPCGESGQDDVAAAAATMCCVAPVSSEAAATGAARLSHDDHAPSFDAPDVHTAVVLPDALKNSPRLRRGAVLSYLPPYIDAALTYLHTGRLRL